MNTCKDCIYYVVCGQYDMYGDCAEKCFDFFKKPHSVKQVRAKTASIVERPHYKIVTVCKKKRGFVRTSTAVKTRKKLLMQIVIVVSQKGQSYE